ncbi:MAG: TRAP transporter small permease [Rubrivivax sp.]
MSEQSTPHAWPVRLARHAMATCLGLMALLVFVNIVLRYGFGSGIAASEELSRLLFVWMVFIGATAAYPAGEHMAFTSLAARLRQRPAALAVWTALIRLLVLLAAAMVAWGAWQQVQVGLGSRSPVMGYPMALLPLPAGLACTFIAVVAAWRLLAGAPADLGHEAEVE